MPSKIIIEIGEKAASLQTSDPIFLELVEQRYKGFVNNAASPAFSLDLVLVSPKKHAENEDLQVSQESGRWRLNRGDFVAEWDSASRRGWVRQSPSPFGTDSVLRIVHTLLLAPEGGFLLHSASAVRNGRAFLFAGRSGAGKTTISRLAPADVVLLSDEISYVRRSGEGYRAHGTPFAGELGTAGLNISAPVAALYLLAHGSSNHLQAIGHTEAAQALLENILFFAEDVELVGMVFEAACEFVCRVPVYRLTFTPEFHVWDLIE